MSLGGVCNSGVSYPRAIVSCIPLIGAPVILYNIIKCNLQLDSLQRSPLQHALEKLQISCIGMSAVFSALGGNPKDELDVSIIKLNVKQVLEANRGKKIVSILKESKVNSKLFLINCCIGIAVLVALVAAGVLSMSGGVFGVLGMLGPVIMGIVAINKLSSQIKEFGVLPEVSLKMNPRTRDMFLRQKPSGDDFKRKGLFQALLFDSTSHSVKERVSKTVLDLDLARTERQAAGKYDRKTPMGVLSKETKDKWLQEKPSLRDLERRGGLFQALLDGQPALNNKPNSASSLDLALSAAQMADTYKPLPLAENQ